MTHRRRTLLQVTAGLGLFAMLFQAILFGWHHHDPSFAGRLPATVVEKPATSPQVADDADGCEICQVLHHLTAAPVHFPAAVSPRAIAVAAPSGKPPFVTRASRLGFHARAPPAA